VFSIISVNCLSFLEQTELTQVGFRSHVKIASRIVSYRISEIFYYIISTNVNCYQTHRWWQFSFQQDNALAHYVCNTVKLQGSELSTSFLLIMAFNLTAQQWSSLVMRFRDSLISTSISCKSTRLKKSSSDWLKCRVIEYSIREKRCDFCVFCFTR